jgi:spore coat polysaccharide biosynthesis protein SpsF (cytidylyltransferase family)
MLDFMISKHINVCVLEDYDYVSNVHESCRTIADGFDCEVMTAKALAWLDQNAVSDSDREHVTTLLRTESPKELRQAVVMSKLDTSSLKMSVDTPEDIERIRVYFHTLEQKKEAAQREFGPNVFWV